MENKTLKLMVLSVFTLALLAGLGSALTLAEWPLTSDGVATPVDSSVSAGDLAFGSTLANTGFDATDGANATGWNLVSLGANDYYEVTLNPNLGFDLTITSVSFGHISDDGTTNMSFDVEYSTDAFVSSNNLVSSGTSTTTSASSSTITSIAVNDGETLSLRIFGYGSDSSSTEVFSVKNLLILGTVNPISTEPEEVLECNAVGNPGELDVKNIRFDNKGVDSAHSSFGSDDEWFPLEEIEVEIEIENDGNFDVDDIEVSWGLWDVQNSEWVIDYDDEKDFNLKDGKEEQLFVTFFIDDDMEVDLEDLDDGDHYRLYVTALGTIDDNDSPNDGEDTCASDFESTSIIIENDFVVLDNIEFPEVVSCGETVTVTADVWNIGDSDQDEVSVFVFNKDLDLREKLFK